MSIQKTGRNDLCPCGSGKKYKQCCMANTPIPAATSQALSLKIYQAMQAAWMHQQAGRTAQAESICHQILAVEPKQPEALHLLGVISLQD
jgi:hypothetical protein